MLFRFRSCYGRGGGTYEKNPYMNDDDDDTPKTKILKKIKTPVKKRTNCMESSSSVFGKTNN